MHNGWQSLLKPAYFPVRPVNGSLTAIEPLVYKAVWVSGLCVDIRLGSWALHSQPAPNALLFGMTNALSTKATLYIATGDCLLHFNINGILFSRDCSSALKASVGLFQTRPFSCLLSIQCRIFGGFCYSQGIVGLGALISSLENILMIVLFLSCLV